MSHAIYPVGRVRGQVLGRASLLLWAMIALALSTQSAVFVSGQLERHYGSLRVTMAPSIRSEFAQPAPQVALAGIGDLTVAAPSGERSGASHSISVRRPVACEEVAPGRWSIDGTPADSVIIALHKLLDGKPDLVVSGINLGANVGQNIHYSGTVGAALEAIVNRIPAFALSIATRNAQCDWAPAARLGRRVAHHAEEPRAERRAAVEPRPPIQDLEVAGL